jgi:hypothetical protein
MPRPIAAMRGKSCVPGTTGLATSSLVEDSLRWRTSFPVRAATDA